MDKAIYDRSLSYWTMAIYYLGFVSVALRETIKHGNPWFVVKPDPITEEQYDEETQWSDFNIIVPLLFDFYHGLELLLKGFVLLKQPARRNPNHQIEELLTEFRSLYDDQADLTSLLAKYIEPDTSVALLREFFDSNRCTTNRFFEILRYPENKNATLHYLHRHLKYREADSIQFFKNMVADIDAIRRHSVQIGRSFEPNTFPPAPSSGAESTS